MAFLHHMQQWQQLYHNDDTDSAKYRRVLLKLEKVKKMQCTLLTRKILTSRLTENFELQFLTKMCFLLFVDY